MGEAVRCFATLLLTSVPLSIAMLVMLRYAALLRSSEVSLMGGLAVAAMTSFALSLFHHLDATMMILIWNLGSAIMVATLSAVFGRSMFAWMAARLMPTLEGSSVQV
jgi:Negative regulator of sigma F